MGRLADGLMGGPESAPGAALGKASALVWGVWRSLSDEELLYGEGHTEGAGLCLCPAELVLTCELCLPLELRSPKPLGLLSSRSTKSGSFPPEWSFVPVLWLL